MDELRKSIGDRLQIGVDHHQDALAKIAGVREQLASVDLGSALYTVEIHSLYSNLAEESVTVCAAGRAEAIDRAEWEFERLNGRVRTDGALRYAVTVEIAGTPTSVPKEQWLHYTRQRV